MGNIEIDYPNNIQKRKEEVIKKWLKTGGESLFWETLCEALRSKLVGRPDVAETITVYTYYYDFCVNNNF